MEGRSQKEENENEKNSDLDNHRIRTGNHLWTGRDATPVRQHGHTDRIFCSASNLDPGTGHLASRGQGKSVRTAIIIAPTAASCDPDDAQT